MKTIKIKNLDKNQELVGMKLILPKHTLLLDPQLKPKMFIKSGWNKGFWLVHKITDSRIFPVFFEDFKEVGEWKVEA